MDTKELEQSCRAAKLQMDRLMRAYIGLSVEELIRMSGRAELPPEEKEGEP